ncbi:hypothetical protein ACQI4L_09095 [Mycolicibacterium litorale]|uniref:hypothetical protein n=1 Tax=Mycolicibacterium litorale TaxID=758802 RepID=UPI003CF40222
MGIINSDEFATVSSANGGELLKSYDVEINGHKTTVKLTDTDARRRGLLDDAAGAEEVVELRARVAELEGQLSEAVTAAEEKVRAAVEAQERAEAKAEAAQAKVDAANAKSAAPANKQAPAPQNKGGSAAGEKADG